MTDHEISGGTAVPDDTENIEEFRLRVREFVSSSLPRATDASAGGDHMTTESTARTRSLQRTIFDGGFAGIRYPREYGGMGLTAQHQRVFLEEAEGYELPHLMSVTLAILGPTLLDHGSEELKRRHIPAMLRGDEMWVQFLSEPGGGSDMAGALTRATRDGDTYILSGSKTWSTGADHADYAMVLCRTNWDAPKHRGLSMIVLRIDSPGVTVTPIRLASGTAHFCEEFFDDVVVPADNIVGRPDQGWNVASRLLFHERNMVGGNGMNDAPDQVPPRSGDPLLALARAVERTGDPVVRQLLGEAMVLTRLAGPTATRVETGMRTGEIPGPGASLLKLLTALTEYRRHEIGVEIAGAAAGIWDDGDGTAQETGVGWLTARTSTIAGGTNEMQRNQISERVLGLPREAAPDRDLPFRQVRHNAAPAQSR